MAQGWSFCFVVITGDCFPVLFPIWILYRKVISLRCNTTVHSNFPLVIRSRRLLTAALYLQPIPCVCFNERARTAQHCSSPPPQARVDGAATFDMLGNIARGQRRGCRSWARASASASQAAGPSSL